MQLQICTTSQISDKLWDNFINFEFYSYRSLFCNFDLITEDSYGELKYFYKDFKVVIQLSPAE